jgi:NADPH-dependent curcumin reductase CurA
VDIPARSQEVRLASRPVGPVTPDHFEVVDTEVGAPGEGQVLVRNDWMGVGYMMSLFARTEYRPDLPLPVYRVGEVPWSPSVGTVVRSESAGLAVGDLVFHRRGWREYTVGDAAEFDRVDPGLLPGPQYFLAPGPTAWRGVVEVAHAGAGDTVFVSGAAGGVGSLAGQIAKRRGAEKVIGSAGSKSKVDFLVEELGYDAAFDYHDGPVADRLDELAPEGIDAFFDIVGGEQFDAALGAAAPGARFALCGAVSGQNPTLDIGSVIARDVTIRGFTSSYTPEHTNAWNERFGRWLQEGRFIFPHTVVEGGPAQAPQALAALLNGEFTGSVLVKLS